MTRYKNLTERYFYKYEYLADYYAKKIWNTENICLEKEDIAQELKLKLLTSIKAYARKWAQYRKGNGHKPVLIEYYLRSSMILKSRDFMKEISRVKTVPMSHIDFDYGTDLTEDLDIRSGKLIVDGFNFLDIFKGEERLMMKLHLRGINEDKICKIFKRSKLDPTVTNKLNLKVLKEELKKSNTVHREFSVSHYED